MPTLLPQRKNVTHDRYPCLTRAVILFIDYKDVLINYIKAWNSFKDWFLEMLLYVLHTRAVQITKSGRFRFNLNTLKVKKKCLIFVYWCYGWDKELYYILGYSRKLKFFIFTRFGMKFDIYRCLFSLDTYEYSYLLYRVIKFFVFLNL